MGESSMGESSMGDPPMGESPIGDSPMGESPMGDYITELCVCKIYREFLFQKVALGY